MKKSQQGTPAYDAALAAVAQRYAAGNNSVRDFDPYDFAHGGSPQSQSSGGTKYFGGNTAEMGNDDWQEDLLQRAGKDSIGQGGDMTPVINAMMQIDPAKAQQLMAQQQQIEKNKQDLAFGKLTEADKQEQMIMAKQTDNVKKLTSVATLAMSIENAPSLAQKDQLAAKFQPIFKSVGIDAPAYYDPTLIQASILMGKAGMGVKGSSAGGAMVGDNSGGAETSVPGMLNTDPNSPGYGSTPYVGQDPAKVAKIQAYQAALGQIDALRKNDPTKSGSFLTTLATSNALAGSGLLGSIGDVGRKYLDDANKNYLTTDFVKAKEELAKNALLASGTRFNPGSMEEQISLLPKGTDNSEVYKKTLDDYEKNLTEGYMKATGLPPPPTSSSTGPITDPYTGKQYTQQQLQAGANQLGIPLDQFKQGLITSAQQEVQKVLEDRTKSTSQDYFGMADFKDKVGSGTINHNTYSSPNPDMSQIQQTSPGVFSQATSPASGQPTTPVAPQGQNPAMDSQVSPMAQQGAMSPQMQQQFLSQSAPMFQQASGQGGGVLPQVPQQAASTGGAVNPLLQMLALQQANQQQGQG